MNQKYEIKMGREFMREEDIEGLIKQTYWASGRSMEITKKALDHSICFGAFLKENGKQIGLVRVITDYATTYYICDVIVDEHFRRDGIGKALMERVDTEESFDGLRGMLVTQDAHGLYEQYGFVRDGEYFMTKKK